MDQEHDQLFEQFPVSVSQTFQQVTVNTHVRDLKVTLCDARDVIQQESTIIDPGTYVKK